MHLLSFQLFVYSRKPLNCDVIFEKIDVDKTRVYTHDIITLACCSSSSVDGCAFNLQIIVNHSLPVSAPSCQLLILLRHHHQHPVQIESATVTNAFCAETN